MKSILFLSIFILLVLVQSVKAKTVEIDVHGMTCALCVDTLNRKFNKMEGVSKVEVSMKLKKVRLETKADVPKIEVIKQAVMDAGFTPVKITVLPDEKAKTKR